MSPEKIDNFKIINELGLHARAAATFVKTASRFISTVEVAKDNIKVNGKSIMGVLMLAAAKGSTIQISANGPDADRVVEALGSLIKDKFGEDN